MLEETFFFVYKYDLPACKLLKKESNTNNNNMQETTKLFPINNAERVNRIYCLGQTESFPFANE